MFLIRGGKQIWIFRLNWLCNFQNLDYIIRFYLSIHMYKILHKKEVDTTSTCIPAFRKVTHRQQKICHGG